MSKRQTQTKINLFQQALQLKKMPDLVRGFSLLINTTSRGTIMLTSPATLIFFTGTDYLFELYNICPLVQPAMKLFLHLMTTLSNKTAHNAE